jgi:hypothetical protein
MREPFVSWVAYLGPSIAGPAVLLTGPIGEPLVQVSGSAAPEPVQRAAERQPVGVISTWLNQLDESLEVARSMGTTDRRKVRAAEKAREILARYAK